MPNAFVLTAQARDDLVALRDFIARDDPRAALRLLESLRAAFRRLAEFPEIGRERPDLASRPVRTWPVGPYLIVYETAARTTILRVVSGYRDLPELFD